MKMKINFEKQKSKDTFYTIEPINWLLVVFNLSSVRRKENKIVVSWSLMRSLVHIIAFGIINFYFLFIKINRLVGVKRDTVVMFSDSIQMIYLFGYVMHVVDLQQVYVNGRTKYLKYYEIFDSIDKILGMQNYDEIRKIITNLTLISSLVTFAICVFDYFAWVEGYGFVSPTLYCLDYFYFYLNILTLLDGASQAVQIKYRLKTMRRLLHDYYFSNGIKSVDDDQILTIHSIKQIDRLGSLQSVNNYRYVEDIDFTRCYLLLLEQAKFINIMFGYRVIAFCISALVNMITLINITIRLIVGSMITPLGAVCLPAVSSMMRFLNWAIVCIIVAYHAEITYKEHEHVLEVIDLILYNKNNSSKLKVTLAELRNLLVTRPIRYHGAHFFNIDYSILVSISSVVVTYTIIMLQSIK